MSNQNCELETLLYIGSATEARTRLAVARLPKAPISVIVATGLGGPQAFRARYLAPELRKTNDNIADLFPMLGPAVVSAATSRDSLRNLHGISHVFVESIPGRPANVGTTIASVLQLCQLTIDTQASISAGLFAAAPTEALLFEQCLMDLGVKTHQIIAGWLTGIGNTSTRVVRFSAASFIKQCEIHLPELYRDTSRVPDWNINSMTRGVRL
ncbi:MAG: hypothetical protein FJ146_18370 [Deltaproteobacteria bacterium]|nr:hypothetical protein [Deltaproteobacteria bacterium]